MNNIPNSLLNFFLVNSYIIEKLLFPALNPSNNFATFDSEAHINTKSDYFVNHVFKTMFVAELTTLDTICPHLAL